MSYTKEQRIVNQLVGKSNIPPQESNFILPNHSGDHSAGHTGTPTQDLDLANKKYVDDENDKDVHLDQTTPQTTTGTFTFDRVDTDLLGIKGSTTSANGTESEAGSLGTSLISHWKMNDNAANTTVVDTKGNHNGTAQANTNTLDTTGKINGALTFNGSSHYIYLGVGGFATATFAAGSISAWVNLSSKASTAYIFNCYGVLMIYYDSGTDKFKCENYPNSGALSTTTSPTLDTWHLITMTWDGTNTKLYMDNVLEATGTGGTPDLDTYDDRHVQIGCSGGFTLLFPGILDDFRIYNKALTQEEVTALYNFVSTPATATLNYDQLVALLALI